MVVVKIQVVRETRITAAEEMRDVTTICELLYITSPAVNRTLCVSILAAFFLWIRFLLC